MRLDRFLLGFSTLLLHGSVGHAQAAPVVEAVAGKSFPEAQQPQLAVSPTGKIFLTFGSGHTIYCTTSDDGGQTFGTPVRVAELGALALGMRRGPRVAATRKVVLITAIGGTIGKGRDEDLLAWRSTDEGKSWQGPVRVNTVAGSAREGLHHTTAAPNGTFYSVWLDLRQQKTQVYGAAAPAEGDRWHAEKLIYESPDGNVCECCQPQAAYDARGTLHVQWRNHRDGSRDMYWTRSPDHGQTFAAAVKLGQGRWPLNACPMDGGGLAADATGVVTTLWRRKHKLFRCIPGQPEVALGPGEQGWAAAGPGGVSLVWNVGRPGAVMALTPDAKRPLRLADAGSDPVVAGPVSGSGPVVAAWEEGARGSKRLRTTVLVPAPH